MLTKLQVKHLSGFILLLCFIISCKTINKPVRYYYGTFKFKQKPDEIYLKPGFIAFLEKNPNCSMVLRVPKGPENLVEEESYKGKSNYFAIEKILVESNFVLRDRAVFEKSFKNDSSCSIQTDLILELVDFKKVNYYTNKVIPENKKEIKGEKKETPKEETEISLSNHFYFTGAVAEFKIINLHTNEVVATFVMNYTPCTKGCRMKYTESGHIEEVDGDFKTRKKNGYESLDTDESMEMFKELTRRMVYKLKNPSGY